MSLANGMADDVSYTLPRPSAQATKRSESPTIAPARTASPRVASRLGADVKAKIPTSERDREEEAGVRGGGKGDAHAHADLVDRPDHFADSPAEGRCRKERPGNSGPVRRPVGSQATADGGG